MDTLLNQLARPFFGAFSFDDLRFRLLESIKTAFGPKCRSRFDRAAHYRCKLRRMRAELRIYVLTLTAKELLDAIGDILDGEALKRLYVPVDGFCLINAGRKTHGVEQDLERRRYLLG